MELTPNIRPFFFLPPSDGKQITNGILGLITFPRSPEGPGESVIVQRGRFYSERGDKARHPGLSSPLEVPSCTDNCKGAGEQTHASGVLGSMQHPSL